MFNRYHVLFMSIFSFLDVAFTWLAFFLADSVFPIVPVLRLDQRNAYFKIVIYLGITMIWGVMFRLFPIYKSKRAMPILHEIFDVGAAVVMAWLVFIGVLFVYGLTDVSRNFLLLFGFLNLVFLLGFHVFLRICLRIIRLKGYNIKTVLIVGAEYAGKLVAQELRVHPWTGYSVMGFLDDNPGLKGKKIHSIPVLGGVSDICQIVQGLDQDDEVIIALPASEHSSLVEVIHSIEDAPVNIRIVPDFFDIAYIRPQVEDLWGIPLIGIRNPSIPPAAAFAKRCMDIVGAACALIVSFLFVPLIALAIKLDSEGPILFVQERTGENGKPFKIYKFRTMVKNAEDKLEELIDLDELDEPVFKIKNDPRVTRVGKFLRRTSLDEIPQFLNVLKGDMSLVGPRPEESRLVRSYNSRQRRRLMMKPGLTGPAQVNGRGDLSLAERVELEEEYIRNYTLWKDFEILLKTIPTVIRGKGSY